MSEKDYIFSKELREEMAEFNDMDARDAIRSPDFFNKLLKFVGMTEEEQKALWEKVGRPDCFKENNDN